MNLTYAVFRNGKRMLSLLLAVCLTAGLLGYVAQAADEPAEILSFERTNPVFEAEVDPGTERGDLGLPETLRAVVSLEGKALEDPAFIQAAPDPDTAYVYLPDREEPAGGYADGDYIAPEDAPERYSSGETVTYSVWSETDGTPEYRIYGSVNGGEDHWYAVDPEENITGEVLDVNVQWAGTFDPNVPGLYTLYAETETYSFRCAAPYAEITVTGEENRQNAVVPLAAGTGESYTVDLNDTILIPMDSSFSGPEENAGGLIVRQAYTQATSIPSTGSTVQIVFIQDKNYLALTDQSTGTFTAENGAAGLAINPSHVFMTGGGTEYVGFEDPGWTLGRTGNFGNYTYSFRSNGTDGRYLTLSRHSGSVGNAETAGSASYFTLSGFSDGCYRIGHSVNGSTFYLDFYNEGLACSYLGGTETNQHWRIYQKADYAVVQGLAVGTYTIRIDGQTVSVTVKDPEGRQQESAETTGTTVRLLDYWLYDEEAGRNWTDLVYSGGWNQSYRMTKGINTDSNLKFSVYGVDGYGGWNVYDGNYYDGKSPYYGIMERTLGADGYPYMNISDSQASLSGSSGYLFDPETEHSGKTGFNNVKGLLQYGNGDRGSDTDRSKYDGYYYYNSNLDYAYFDEADNEFILYDLKGEYAGSGYNGALLGFFPFATYSQAEAALESSGSVTDPYLNHFFGLNLETNFVQRYGGHTDSSENTDTTFYFAGDDDVWIFIDDVLIADLGGNHGSVEVEINFATGRVIVNGDETTRGYPARLGHSTLGYTTTLKAMFEDVGMAGDARQWNGDTFADNTIHTLSFYYFERGHNMSNLELMYNLSEIPETAVYKVDQDGNAINGVTFAVYKTADVTAGADGKITGYAYETLNGYNGGSLTTDALDAGLREGTYVYGFSLPGRSGDDYDVYTADGSFRILEALYFNTTGPDPETGEEGKFVFYKGNVPYALDGIIADFCGDREPYTFILREVVRPENMRTVTSDVCLRIDTSTSEFLLVCDDSYGTGVWTSPRIFITAPTDGTLKLYGDSTCEGSDTVQFFEYDDADRALDINGSLFAVVLKYTDESGSGQISDPMNWAAVWGTDIGGHHLVYPQDQTGTGSVGLRQAALEALKGQMSLDLVNDDPAFSETVAPAGMETELVFTPGDIMTYYHLSGGNPEYVIMYYWMPDGITPDSASVDQLYPVSPVREENAFGYQYGASIEVANLLNRVYVQKDNEEGELINGARFAMYKVEEPDAGIWYYVSDNGTYISLDADENGDNIGTARLPGGGTGTYTINDGTENSALTGVITVTIGSSVYTISPWDWEDTVEAGGICANNSVVNDSTEDGTAVFDGLGEGCYIVREVYAPNPYVLNTAEIKVLAADDTIYANAGTADDGVVVARGAGRLAATMLEAASLGDINRTLSWIFLALRVDEASNDTFDIVNRVSSWNYAASRTSGGTASSLQDAMRSYLVYTDSASGVLFNYILDPDAADFSGNPGTRRMWTEVGWSFLEIYQSPYHYLDALNAGEEIIYDYEKLYDESSVDPANGYPAEYTAITNLYTRSVYIRVTDGVEPLLLYKADGDSIGVDDGGYVTEYSALAGAQFRLYILAGNEAGDPASSETVKKYYVYDSETGSISWTGEEDEATILTSGDAGYIGISHPPAADPFYLEEINPPVGYPAVRTVWTVSREGDGETGWTVSGGSVYATSPGWTYYVLHESARTEAGNPYEAVQVLRDTESGAWYYEGTDGDVTLYLNEADGILYTDAGFTAAFGRLYDRTAFFIANYRTFTLYKIDGSDVTADDDGNVTGFTALPGAAFILSRTAADEETGETVTYYYTLTGGEESWIPDDGSGEAERNAARILSGASGEIVLPSLSEGTYSLQEVAAPDGYLVLSNPWTITVQQGGGISVDPGFYATASPETFILMALDPDMPDRFSVVEIAESTADGQWTCTVDGEAVTLYQDPADGLLYTTYDEGTYGGSFYQLMRPTVWYIPNYRTYELPAADGRATPLICSLAGGSALMLAGGCMMWMRFRRRGGKSLN